MKISGYLLRISRFPLIPSHLRFCYHRLGTLDWFGFGWVEVGLGTSSLKSIDQLLHTSVKLDQKETDKSARIMLIDLLKL